MERALSASPSTVVANWWAVCRTCNLPASQPMDPISRWLLITRACVFPMTLTSALIGGLLAAATAVAARWDFLALAAVGLVIAHATNNMLNDYFDLAGGVDTREYARALYAPHPVLGGLISREGLRAAVIAFMAVDAVIGAVLLAARGWPVAVFAGLGLFVSVFYVAPPIKLKHHGLGEPGVFVVWGPLMIGGTYFVTAGALPAWVWLASVPYAIVVTTVLIGKHIDKYAQDNARGIRTLPVIFGPRVSLALNQVLMIGFYVAVGALAAGGTLGPGVLLVVFAIPRLLRVLKAYSQPKPAAPPPNYPVWPLWFVALAFHHNRLAGPLFVAGLLVNLVLPFGAGR